MASKFVTGAVIVGTLSGLYILAKQAHAQPPPELTLYEYNREGDEADTVYDYIWKGQSFTPGTVGPAVAHTVELVKLCLGKVGYPTGNFECSIRAVDADNLPTGPDLAYGSIPCDSIPEWHTIWTEETKGWIWIEFPMAEPYYVVEPGVMFALAYRANEALGVDPQNYFGIRMSYHVDAYPGGEALASWDYGVTWHHSGTEIPSINEHTFEIWGRPVA